MRLIDADNIFNNKLLVVRSECYDAVHAVVERINNAPTVDAEPVVRCKDCIHAPTGSGVGCNITFPEQDYKCPCRCDDPWYSWRPDDDWFCAYGERRKDETD